jgi:hypothetical protein
MSLIEKPVVSRPNYAKTHAKHWCPANIQRSGEIDMIGLVLVAVMSAQAAPSVTATSPALDPNKRICKTIKTTGSRLGGKRLCATRAEWDRIERETQEDVRAAQSQSKQPGNQ